MTVVEFVVKLGLGKDKFGSSKSKKRGVCNMDHKEDVVDVMATATIVVIGNHELGRRNLRGKGTS
ncbi:hypothetical protein Goklo_006032 [Gossypium klotzschianum]|uniref:Uncharacterized protein n=1 Tax=Gossypium klotzschianum TaxID=34286 RepID=A0A7J8VGP4_9ROSI|nr:hypothetical protein [Gossypium klotzschianum]